MKHYLLSPVVRITTSALAAIALWPAALARAADVPQCVTVGVGLGATSGVNSGQQVCGDPATGGVIVTYLTAVLKFLSIGIGVVILLMLIIAGIQYITSAGDPGQIKKAKDRIISAITALILFLIGNGLLNYLIPGGIF